MASTRMSGIAAMLAAVGVFALMDAQLKLLVEHYPTMQVTSLRGLASLPFVLAHIAIRRRFDRVWPRRWGWHLLRAVIAIAMLAGFVYSVQHLSLADTYAIYMCAPLLITALSVPLLGERVSAAQWIAIFVGLTGVLIMLRPGGSDWALLAALAAVGSAICYALAAIMLRLLARSETTESLVLSFTVLMFVGAGLLALPHWEPLQWRHAPWLVGIGLCGASAQFLMTEAFARAPASVVAPLEYTALIWGVVLDVVVWHVLPGGVTIAGGLIVIGAGLYLIRSEAQESRQDSRKR
jgi:drug/metabolite transporter (DMT)-like permease